MQTRGWANLLLRGCCGALIIVGLAYVANSIYFSANAAAIASRADVELVHGRIETARNCLSSLLWFHPRNAHANLALGRIELAEGATEKAIDCFQVVRPESDLHRQASILLSRTFAHDGQLTAAEAELERYLHRYDTNESIWDLYFRILYLQARTRDVVGLFERKLADNPNSLSDVMFLLKAEFVPQEPREALEVLEAIHSKHPDDVNALVALAIAVSRSNDQPRAEQLLRSALDRQNGNHRARIFLAQWLADRHELSTAQEVLWQDRDKPDPQESGEIYQDDRFWSLSSRLVEQAGDANLALQYIDRALQIRTNDKQYLTQRAQILRRLSRKQEAVAVGEQAIKVGRIEQELFLLARQLEDRPMSVGDCKLAARLYGELGRPGRAELWNRLASEIERLQQVRFPLEERTIP